jgi:hypothetical protein
VRKTILEKVRDHTSMGVYVITSIRNTPLATSSMFDDLGRTKYDAAAFREINGDAVLVLEQGRARKWKHGGDRPDPIDLFNRVSGETLDFRLVLSHSNADLPGGDLQWSLTSADGQIQREGSIAISRTAPGTVPHEIARLIFTAPEVATPQEFTLNVELSGTIRNHWPIWIYPAITSWGMPLALYDPAGTLAGLDDLQQSALDVTHSDDFTRLDNRILLAGAFTPAVAGFIRQGGRAILLQSSAGSLPVVPRPFWREAIKLLYEHPVLDNFPHQGYANLQFYHLASDYAFDTERLRDIASDAIEVTPILRRLDARLFDLSEYLVELKIGSGRAIASTLGFAGGAGDQVNGLKANIAGRWLLYQMLTYLQS